MSKQIQSSGGLLACWDRLDNSGREQLAAFAEFLVARQEDGSRPIPAPVLDPRPEAESVVAALKRLSRGYHMVDRSQMLPETSALMSQHVMDGRAAHEVIDELELLFERHYQRLLGGQ